MSQSAAKELQIGRMGKSAREAKCLPTIPNLHRSPKSHLRRHLTLRGPARHRGKGFAAIGCSVSPACPPWMYRESIDRLTRGELPIVVARWILQHDERGGLNGITSVNTLRGATCRCLPRKSTSRNARILRRP
jgi:hypothetical protein